MPTPDGQSSTGTATAEPGSIDIDYSTLGAVPLTDTPVDKPGIVTLDDPTDEGGDGTGLDDLVTALGTGENLDNGKAGEKNEVVKKEEKKTDTASEKSNIDGDTKSVDTGDRTTAFRTFAEGLISKRTGKPFKLPENVTEDNLLPFYEQMVIESLHPEVRRFQTAVQNGAKPEEYLKQYSRMDSLLALDDEALMMEHYKADNLKTDANPSGWTEDEIKEIVTGIKSQPGQIKLKAKEVRDALREEKREQEKASLEYGSGTRIDVSSPEYRQQFDTGFGASWTRSLGTEKDFYGLDISKPESAGKVKDRVRFLLMPDKGNGSISPFARDMNDPDKVVRMALLWDLHQKGFLAKQGKSRTVKRGEFLDMLDKTPTRSSPANSAGTPNQIDIEALLQPEQLHVRG